jgi:4'-phosphopantetheinyl transferase EntD
MDSAERALQTLFGEGVKVCAVDGAATPDPLHALEARTVRNAIPKRREEFARGRMCAKIAVARLTGGACVLPRALDGAPVWPGGVVGSLSHCRGLCCAVVGANTKWHNLGVDVETVQAIPERQLLLILTETEMSSCDATAIDPLIVFSAKEAFYKCHFPLFRSFLRFRDVQIEIEPTTQMDGLFHAEVLDARLPGAAAARLVRGAWSKRGGFLFAAAALARA